MPAYKDQIGNTIHLDEKPLRIISIVPSQSEFLWDIGLRDELIGITRFCIHPEQMFRSIERVGGTKNLNLDKIRSLKPDLIIGNKEENERSQIEELQREFPVWMSDIYNFQDSFSMMKSLGEILNKKSETEYFINKIEQSLDRIKASFKLQKLAYFIWNDPYMCVAENTFIDHVINHIGFENTLKDYKRYPELSVEELKTLSPEICFLSSEPFPFKERHVEEMQKILPGSKIVIVDGEVFSWYGTRLLHLENYLEGLRLKI